MLEFINIKILAKLYKFTIYFFNVNLNNFMGVNDGEKIFLQIMGFISVSADICIFIFYLLHKKIRVDIVTLLVYLSMIDAIYLISVISIFTQKTKIFGDNNDDLRCELDQIFDIISSVWISLLILSVNLNLYYNLILKKKFPNLKCQLLVCFLVTTIISVIVCLFDTRYYQKDPLETCELQKNRKTLLILFIYNVPIYLIVLISIFTFIKILISNKEVLNDSNTTRNFDGIEVSKVEFNTNSNLIDDNSTMKNNNILSEDLTICRSFSFMLINYSLNFGISITKYILETSMDIVDYDRMDIWTSIFTYSWGLINFLIFISNNFIRTSIVNWWTEKKPYDIK